MKPNQLTLLALTLAALLAWTPEASAQRGGVSRGSSRPSSPSRGVSTPSRPSVSYPSRPSVSSPSRSSVVSPPRSSPSRSAPSSSSSRSAPPSSSTSRSGASRSSGSSARTIVVSPGSSSSSSSSSGSRSAGAESSSFRSGSSGSGSSSSFARSYGLPSSTPSADSTGASGPGSARGLSGGSSSGWGRGEAASRSGGSGAPWASSPGGAGEASDGSMIYAAPRRVPFPSPASSSSPSTRSVSPPAPAPFGNRSSSGPSAGRFGLDRGQSERGGLSSARTGGDRPDTGPSASRGSSRSGDPGGLSSRTRPAPPAPGVDRQSILDRYRGSAGTGADGRPSGGQRGGPATGRGGDRGGLDTRGSGSTSARSGARSDTGQVGARNAYERGGARTGGDGSRGSDGGPLGKPSGGGRSGSRGYEDTRPLRDLAARDPRLAGEVGRIGRAVGHGQRTAFETGLSACVGVFGYNGWGIGAGYWDNGLYLGFWGGYRSCYWNYGYWWALGGYPYSYYCHPFSYPYYCYYGYWPRIWNWYPSCYYPSYYSYPVYTASVITRYVYDEPAATGGGDTYIYVNGDEEPAQYVSEQPYEQVGRGEAFAGAPSAPAAQAPGPDSASRATGQYLTLGDQAFRDGRFADAVHFYARAVQFSPEDGVVWLVLSDGLFATGDYHYGAFSLRKALELDPTLAQNAVDKRGFYADATEFDRQIAVLEGFVQDHPNDADALLMLSANYLFGGRPAEAVDLLEEPRAESVRSEPAGAALLQAARAIQYGDR